PGGVHRVSPMMLSGPSMLRRSDMYSQPVDRGFLDELKEEGDDFACASWLRLELVGNEGAHWSACLSGQVSGGRRCQYGEGWLRMTARLMIFPSRTRM